MEKEKKKSTVDVLMKSAMAVVAEEGLENTTTKKIAEKAGLAEIYIYRHFTSKEELIRECFLETDAMVAELLYQALSSEVRAEHGLEDACKKMWFSLWDFLMQDADRTIFYCRFLFSGYRTKELIQKRTEIFEKLILLIKLSELLHDVWMDGDEKIILPHALGETVSYAMEIQLKNLDCTDDTVQKIFRIVCQPLWTVVRKIKKPE